MPFDCLSNRRCTGVLGGLCGLALMPGIAQAQLTPDEIRQQIGWYDLRDRIGEAALPTGAGVSILQCEAAEGGTSWGPNPP